jgi:hypothetical protein
VYCYTRIDKGDAMTPFAVIVALAGAVIATSAAAQSGSAPMNAVAEASLTMRLMPANAESPAVITATIELRKDNAELRKDSPGEGISSAKSAETAGRAREDGRAVGEAAAAAARDNRESASRGSRPDLPEDRPPAPDRHAPISR